MKSSTAIKIMISGIITTCSIKSLFQHFKECAGVSLQDKWIWFNWLLK